MPFYPFPAETINFTICMIIIVLHWYALVQFPFLGFFEIFSFFRSFVVAVRSCDYIVSLFMFASKFYRKESFFYVGRIYYQFDNIIFCYPIIPIRVNPVVFTSGICMPEVLYFIY